MELESEVDSKSPDTEAALLDEGATTGSPAGTSTLKGTWRFLVVGGLCATVVCLGSVCLTSRQWGPEGSGNSVADLTKVEGKSCSNSAGHATDLYGDGCDWYVDEPDACGGFDDDDFTASTMCCACKGSHAGGSDTSKKCHVMYKMADNDLDAAIAEDVAELIANTAAVEDEKYFPLIFIDRHEGQHGSDRIEGLRARNGRSQAGHYTGVRYIKKDFRTKKVKVVKELGEKDADKKETITAFLTWAFQECMNWDRAAKVILHFSSHGGGWYGFGGDEGGEKSFITNSGIKSAIQASMQAVSPKIPKLTLLGFDACLMQSYIAMSIFAPLTEYYMASEAVEPGHGWDFSGVLPSLSVKGMADQMILKFAMEKHGYATHEVPKTLSIYKSASFGPFKVAMDAVFDKMRQGLPSLKPTIVKARSNSLAFEGVLEIKAQVDLGDFLKKMQNECSKGGSRCSGGLKSAIRRAMAKYQDMASSGFFKSGPGTPRRSTGMAALFPEAKDASNAMGSLYSLSGADPRFKDFSGEAWMKFLMQFLGQDSGSISSCHDSDHGATDTDGDGCSAYDPDWCGEFDDGDFKSKEMCCVCGGGGR